MRGGQVSDFVSFPPYPSLPLRTHFSAGSPIISVDGGIEKTVEPEEVVLSVFAAKKKQRNYRLPTTPVPITTRRAANKAHEAVVKPVESVPVKDSDPVVQEVVSPTVEAGPKVTVPPSAPENLAPATAQLEVQKAGSRSPKKRSSTASPRRGARNAKTEDTPRAALPQNEAADDGEVGLKSPGSPVKSAPSSGTTKRRQRRRLIDDTGDPLTEDYSMVVDRKPPPRTMPVVKDDILPVPPSPKVERDDESELSSLDEIIEQTLREGSMVSMGESVADESLQEGSVGGPPDGDVDMEIANGESAMEDAVEDAGPREVRKYKRRRRKRKSEVGPKRKRGTGGASDAEAGRGGDDGEGERGNKAKRRKGGRDPFGTSGGRYLGVSAPSNLQNPFRAMERKNLTYVTGEEMDAEAIKNDVAVQEQQLAASEGGEGAGDNARRSHRKPMSAMDRFFTPAAPPRDLNVDFSQLDDSVKVCQFTSETFIHHFDPVFAPTARVKRRFLFCMRRFARPAHVLRLLPKIVPLHLRQSAAGSSKLARRTMGMPSLHRQKGERLCLSE